MPLHSLQLLEKREREAPGGAAHARRDSLRYGARLYRLLGAALQAAHPIAASPSAPPAALDQLRRLALRMSWQAAASCVAVQQEWDARRAGEGSGFGRADADEVGLVLRSKAEVRQRLQGLPFGQLGSLWGVLLAWGAPDACRHTEALLKAVAVPVCCALETCSGGWVVAEPARAARAASIMAPPLLLLLW